MVFFIFHEKSMIVEEHIPKRAIFLSDLKIFKKKFCHHNMMISILYFYEKMYSSQKLFTKIIEKCNLLRVSFL